MKIVSAYDVAGRTPADLWLAQVFGAKAVNRGGVVRRATRDVERVVGRPRFAEEVRRRGFHLVECGGQMIVICNADDLIVHV